MVWKWSEMFAHGYITQSEMEVQVGQAMKGVSNIFTSSFIGMNITGPMEINTKNQELYQHQK